MFCRKCGTELRAGAKFCAKCGAPAPAAAKAEPTRTEPVKEYVKAEPPRSEKTAVPERPVSKPMPKEEPVKKEGLINTMPKESVSPAEDSHKWFTDAGNL